MDRFEDIARRLRARMSKSAKRELSLDWRAADAIDQLLREKGDLAAENEHLREESRTQDAEHETQKRPDAPAVEADRSIAGAIGLRDAASLLGVSYGTVYSHKLELGFFQVGNQWRVWPDKLKALGQQPPRVYALKKAPALPPARVEPDQSPDMSATRAAAEFAKVLSELRSAKARLKRNTARRPKRQ